MTRATRALALRVVLGLAITASLMAAAQAQAVNDSSGSVNEARPANMPEFLWIKNLPLGSGVPALGVPHGYSKAEYVRDGLYHVPGYLPYAPAAHPVEAQVVELGCVPTLNQHVVPAILMWVCDGYRISSQIGRGENILIAPIVTDAEGGFGAAPPR